MSRTLTTSETFTSFQGEGPLTGNLGSAVWIRTARCPFTCSHFNNPERLDLSTNEGLGFDPTKLTSLEEMPEITRGCDSRYSISDNRFAHLWKEWTVDELADHVVSLLPHNVVNWQHPRTLQHYGLTLTGGEPTLQMKFFVEFFKSPALNGLKTITFETNCAVPLMSKHMLELREWCEAEPGRKIVWSNSPKLSISGEPWEKAIVPKNALMQRLVGEGNFTQYFKFVCDATDESFAEVERAMDEYHASGVPKDTEVWIMPMGASVDQQMSITEKVTRMCFERGYHVAWRNHIIALGNAPGR